MPEQWHVTVHGTVEFIKLALDKSVLQEFVCFRPDIGYAGTVPMAVWTWLWLRFVCLFGCAQVFVWTPFLACSVAGR